MAREGKDLELLIEMIEKVMLPEGAIITSPDYIQDKITGEKREVDISIRHKVGSVDILILIECRDRAAAQDVTWIEQVVTKTKDLKANKVIAVSSSRFTKGALTKADHNGIETRTLDEITVDVIKRWWAVEKIGVRSKFYEMRSVSVALDTDENTDEIMKNIDLSEKFIIRAVDQVPHSIYQIFEYLSSEISEWDNLPPNGPILRKEVNANIDQNAKLFIRHQHKEYNITQINFIVDLSIRFSEAPIHKISSYNKGAETISEVIEYKDILGDNTFHVFKDAKGIKMRISPPNQKK